MKKFIIIGLLIIFCIFLLPQSSFASIENNSQYAKEINQVINSQIPVAKKKIDKIEKKFKATKDINKKKALIEKGINDILYDFFMKLICTTDKYFDIKQSMPTSRWHGNLQIYMSQYLEKNGINKQKIDRLNDYVDKKYCDLKFTMLDMSDIPPNVIEFAHQNGYDIVKLDEQLSDEQTKIYKLYSKYDWTPVEGGYLLVFSLVYLVSNENGIRFATKDEITSFFSKIAY